MTATISAVRASQPEQLADGAAEAGKAATTLQQQIDTGRQALAIMRNGWEGTSSDAATASAERTFARQETLVDALCRVQSALSYGGNQLTSTRTSVIDGVARCEQVGFQVADDGTVSLQPGGPLEQLAKMSPVSAMQIQAAAASNSLQLKTQLAGFDAQDTQLAQALHAATAVLPASQSVSTAGIAPASYPGETQGGELDLPDSPEFWTPGLEPIDPGGAAAGPSAGGLAPI